MRNNFGKIQKQFPIILMLIALGAIGFFAVRALAAHIPVVSITAPADGEVVSGVIDISCDYSISQARVHALYLILDGVLVDSIAAGNRSGSESFSLDTSTYDDGEHTITVEAYSAARPSGHFSDDSISVTFENSSCNNDADCDDGDDYTADSCTNPGTADAVCMSDPVDCVNDSDCDDGDALTFDACDNPDTSDSSCSNTVIECNNNADCDDADSLTIDVCELPGTANASCSNISIACNDGADCDDGDAYTQDVCDNGGSVASVCVHNAVVCISDADCNDGDDYTADSCADGGTVSAACVNVSIACLNDGDCDDADALTIDVCETPGIVSASCSNIPIACNIDADCDDSDFYTQDVCDNTGSVASACVYNAVACISDADCDDGDEITTDSCISAGTAAAACLNVACAVACSADADCDDSDAITTDSCVSPGACDAACNNVACDVACSSDTDCDDADEATADTCAAAGTCAAVCEYENIETPELILGVTAPADNTITNVSTIEVTGATISEAALTINGINTIINTDGTFAEIISLDEGANEIEIVVTLEGDTLTETRTIILDTQQPTLVGATPADGAELEITPAAITLTIQDNPGGTGINAAALAVLLDGDDTAGIYNASANTYTATNLDISNGAHMITITAPDLAGNTLIETISFVLTPKGPRVKFTKLPGVKDDADVTGADVPVPVIDDPDSTVPSLLDHPWLKNWKPANTRRFKELVKDKYAPVQVVDAISLPAREAQVPEPLLIEAAVEEGEASISQDAIELTIDGASVESRYLEDEKVVTAQVSTLSIGTHEASVTVMDVNGETSEDVETFSLTAETTSAIDSVPIARTTNVEHPDWTTVAIGENIHVEYSVAEAGLSLTCVAMAGVLEDTEPVALFALQMTESATEAGVYECQGQIMERPLVDEIEAVFVMGVVIQDSDTIISNDILAYRDVLNEVHLENITRPGEIYFESGDEFLISAEGAANQAGIDAMIIPVDISDGPQAAIVSLLFVETPAGSGHYEASGVLQGVMDGITEIRGAAYIAGIAGVTNEMLVLSTEVFSLVMPTIEILPEITSIDGMAVVDKTVESTNKLPVVSGIAAQGTEVTVEEFIEGGSFEIEAVPGGAPLLGTYIPMGTAFYGDEFDDEDFEKDWFLEDYSSGLPDTIYEQNDRFEATLDRGDTFKLKRVKPMEFEHGFTIEAEVIIPSTNLVYSVTPETIEFLAGIEAWLKNPEIDYFTDEVQLIITKSASSPTATIILASASGSGSWPIDEVIEFDQPYKLSIVYDADNVELTLLFEEQILTTQSAVPFGPTQVVASLIFGSYLGQVDINFDSFSTDIPMPSSYDLSGPAFELGGVAYSDLSSDPLFVEQCIEGVSISLIPFSSECISELGTIYAVLVEMKDVYMENPITGGDDPVVMPGSIKQTFYVNVDDQKTAKDVVFLMNQTLVDMKAQGSIFDYEIDAVAKVIDALGSQQDMTPMQPVLASNVLSVPGSIGSLIYRDGEYVYSDGEYLASYSPLSYRGVEFNDWVVFGPAPASSEPEGPILISSADEYTPIWWADGSQDIDVLLTTIELSGTEIQVTGYGDESFLGPTASDSYAYIPSIFTANGPGNDYTWNSAALAAATDVSIGNVSYIGARVPIASPVVADARNEFSAQTTTILSEGTHILTCSAINGDDSNDCPTVIYHVLPEPDTTPPTVSIIYPFDESTPSAAPNAVTVQADDDSGIAQVEVFIDGNSVGIDSTQKTNLFTLPVDLTPYLNTAITISAIATDNADNVSDEASISVTPASEVCEILQVPLLSNRTRDNDETEISPGETFTTLIGTGSLNCPPQFKLFNADEYTGDPNDSSALAQYTILYPRTNGVTYSYIGRFDAPTDVSGTEIQHIIAVASIDGYITKTESNILTITPAQPPAAPEIRMPDDGSTASDFTPRIRGAAPCGMEVTTYLQAGAAPDPATDRIIAFEPTTTYDCYFDTADSENIQPTGDKTIYSIATNPITRQQSVPSETITFFLRDCCAPEVTAYSATPNPFSPNGDGENDTTTISVTVLDETLDVISIIFRDIDSNGLFLYKVDNITDDIPLEPYTITYEWDGWTHKPNQDPQPLPDGMYIYSITTADDYDKRSDRIDGYVEITGTQTSDTESPVIDVLQSAPLAISPVNLTSDGINDSFIFDAGITDDSAVDWWFTVMPIGQSATVWSDSDSGNTVHVEWFGTDMSDNQLPDGAYFTELMVIDEESNSSVATATVSIDDASPIVAIQSPENGSTHEGEVTFTVLTDDGADGTGVKDFKVFVDTIMVGATFTETMPNVFDVTWVSQSGYSSMHNVEITGIDAAGNTGSDTISVIVEEDLEPPIIDEISPLVEFTNDLNTIGKVRVTDSGSGIASVEMGSGGFPFTPVQDSIDPDVYIIQPAFSMPKSIGVVFAVKATDKAGNSFTRNIGWKLDIDSPDVVPVYPLADNFVNTDTPLIKIKIDDVISADPLLEGAGAISGIDDTSISLLIDGQDIGFILTVIECHDYDLMGIECPPHVALIEGQVVSPLSQGQHTITISAADVVGNTVSDSITFSTLDATPPTAELIYPETSYVNDYSITGIVRATDETSGSGVCSVTQTTSQPFKVVADENNSELYYIEMLAPIIGPVHVPLTITDCAGNETEFVTGWFIDIADPIITPLYPLDGGFVNSSTPYIIVNPFDPTGSATGIATETLTVNIDGVTATVSDIYYTTNEFTTDGVHIPDELEFTIDDNLQDGTHTITVSVNDLAGNSGSAEWTFVVADRQPPAIERIYPVGDYANERGISPLVKCYDEPGGSGIKTVKWNGVGLPFTATGTETPSVYELDVYYPGLNILDLDQIPLSVYAEDNARNITEMPVGWFIDQQAPTIEPIYPLADGYAAGATPTISIMLDDFNKSGIDPESLEVFVNGVSLPASFNPSSGIAEVTVVDAVFAVSENTILVEVMDRAGNAAAHEWVFYNDAYPPEGDMQPVVTPAGADPGEDYEFSTTKDLHLTWKAISDNTGGSGIKEYQAEIFDGSQIDEQVTSEPTVNALGQAEDTSCCDGTANYCVIAIDYAGNRSEPQCATITIATGKPGIKGLTVTPDPISPAIVTPGIDTNDIAVFTADIVGDEADYEWVAKVYDLFGSLVSTLPVEGPGTGTVIQFEWDGTESIAGSFVSDGTYGVELTAEVVQTSTSTKDFASIVVDNTPPESQILNIADGTQITVTSYLVEIGILEAVGLEKGSVEFCVDDQPCIPAELREQLSQIYTYAVEWPVAQESAGWHTLTARVTDNAMNTKLSTPIEIKTGQMPVPEVTIIEPVYATSIKGVSNVTVEYSLNQGNVKWVELLISSDGETYDLVSTNQFGAPFSKSGQTSFTIDTLDLNGTPLPDGNYYLKAIAYKNESLNAESSRVKILVDNTPPVFTQFIPEDGALIITSNTTADVEIAAYLSEAGVGIDADAVVMTINGTTHSVQVVTTLDLKQIVRFEPALKLEYGTYQIDLEVKDTIGNISAVSWNFTMQAPPQITNICPEYAAAGETIIIQIENLPLDTEPISITYNYVDLGSGYGELVSMPMDIVGINIASGIITASLPTDAPVYDPQNIYNPHIALNYPLYINQFIGFNTLSRSSEFRILEQQQSDILIENLVFVANTASRNISLIDPETGITVSTIDYSDGLVTASSLSGGSISSIIATPQADYLFAINGGSSLPEEKKKLNVIDTTCSTTIHTIAGISGYKLLLSPDSEKLYVFDTNTTYIIDTALAITDPENALIASVPVAAGRSPQFTADTTSIISPKDAHYTIDPQKLETDPYNSITSRIPAFNVQNMEDDLLAQALTPDGHYIISAWNPDTASDNELRAYDIEKGMSRVSYTIEDFSPSILKTHPAGEYIYAANGTLLQIIDIQALLNEEPADDVIVVSENLGATISDIHFSPDANKVLVTLLNSNEFENPLDIEKNNDTLLIIDHDQSIQTKELVQLTDPIQTGNQPTAIATALPPAPIITDITPDSAHIGETVSITGANFSTVPENNIVILDNFIGNVIDSSATTITVTLSDYSTMSQEFSDEIVVISNSRLSNIEEFDIKAPLIASVYNHYHLKQGDITQIEGVGWGDSQYHVKVLFGDKEAEILSISDGVISVIVPHNAITGDLQVIAYGICSNSFTYIITVPEIRIQTPTDEAVLTMNEDMDGNPENGLQVSIISTSEFPGNSVYTLTVNGIDIMSKRSFQDTVEFEKITLLPPESTIVVSVKNIDAGIANHSEISVVVELPYEESNQIVYRGNDDEVETIVFGQNMMLFQKSLYIYDISNDQSISVDNTENGDMPSWDSVYNRIVYTRFFNIENPANQFTPCITCPGYLYISDVESMQSVPIIIPSDNRMIEGYNPIWSPNGSMVAYFHNIQTTFPAEADLSIIRFSTDSTELKEDPIQITQRIRYNNEIKAVWSLNGRFLIFPSPIGSDEGMMSIAEFSNTESDLSFEIHTSKVDAFIPDRFLTGTGDILSKYLNIVFINNLSLGVSIPIYQALEPNTITHLTADSDSGRIVYSVNPNLNKNEVVSYVVDLSTYERRTLSAAMNYPDWKSEKQYVYNGTPPIITNVSPSDGSYVNSISPIISAKVLDDQSVYECGVSSIQLTVNSVDVSDDILYNSVSGNLSYSTKPDFSFDYFDRVEYSLSVSDCVNNQTQISSSFIINDPPVISDITPEKDSYLNSNFVTIAAKIYDTHGINPDSIKVFVNDIQYPALYSPSLKTMQLSFNAIEGAYDVKISAADIYGYTAQEKWSFKVDKTVPLLIAYSPVPNEGATYYTNQVPDYLEFEIEDNFMIDTSNIKVLKANDMENYYEVPYYIYQNNHSGEVNVVKIKHDPSFELQEGFNIYQLQAFDKAGNPYYNGGKGLLSIGYDIAPPTIKIIRPLIHENTNRNSINFSVQDDFSGIDRDTMTVSIENPLDGTLYSCSYEDIHKSEKGSYYCNPELEVGYNYVFHISVYDNAGNNGTEYGGFYYGTVQDPVAIVSNVTLSSFAIDPRNDASLGISFDLSAAANVSIQIVSFNEDPSLNSIIASLSENFDSEGSYTMNWDWRDNSIIPVDGVYRVKIRSTSTAPSHAIFDYTPVAVPEQGIEITSLDDVFIPDSNDFLVADYIIGPNPAFVTITAKDSMDHVFTLVDHQPRIPGDHRFIWEGKDLADKDITQPGEYTIIIGTVKMPSNCFVVYSDIPEIELEGLSQFNVNPDRYGPDIKFNIRASTYPSYITVTLIDSNGNNIRTIMQNENYSFLPFEYSIGTSTISKPGIYSFKIVAMDSDGAISEPRYVNFLAFSPRIEVSGRYLYFSILPSYEIMTYTDVDGNDYYGVFQDDTPMSVEPYIGQTIYKAHVSDISPGPHTFRVEYFDTAAAGNPVVPYEKTVDFLGPLSLEADRSNISLLTAESVNFSFVLENEDTIHAAILEAGSDDAPTPINDPSKLVHLFTGDNGLVMPAGDYNNRFTWDGTDDRTGAFAVPGQYIFVIYAHTEGKVYPVIYLETYDISVSN